MERPLHHTTRRRFIKNTSLFGAGAALSLPHFSFKTSGKTSHAAILGGEPVRKIEWPEWPKWDTQSMDQEMLNVLHGRVWSRAKITEEFEQKWAEMLGAKRCLAVVNGTQALIASLVQFDIGGGDEVIVPPYTFIASVQAILNTGAMPVFADIDRETYQIDPAKIEEKITARTKAIMPVHILGLPADMPAIMEIAKKHNLIVIEDACQAHMAEINHKKAGTLSHAGCFSFQTSKNLPIGEGGAIVSDDEDFMDRCFSYHNYGNPYGSVVGEVGAGTLILGTKIRITEYQSKIGLLQMKNVLEQSELRMQHAAWLNAELSQVPGIIPARLYPHVTRAVYHLYPFRFQSDAFAGLNKTEFIRSLQAEGIPCAPGYTPLNKMPYLRHALSTKNYRKMYPKKMLDYERYMEKNQCPENDILCNEEIVWIPQNVLLAPKKDLGDIVRAVHKISETATAIKSRIK
ncbi:MAG: DegT/DnrJ/EryC1/StrS family aminotransferase [Cyclobacteriaceae bacterium]|nr:DegT/DnrJ/EryC1/StrS family aminotransferase [Cyclobacteriaceae bacterium]